MAIRVSFRIQGAGAVLTDVDHHIEDGVLEGSHSASDVDGIGRLSGEARKTSTGDLLVSRGEPAGPGAGYGSAKAIVLHEVCTVLTSDDPGSRES
jgi:hypothetical protein